MTTLSQFRPAEILANEALTVTSPISAAAAGQIPYSEGAGVTGLISVGSSGQVLTIASSGLPAWATPTAPTSALTTSQVGYGVGGTLGGSTDLTFENSDGSSTLTIGDGTTNTNQGILQGPNGIGIVIKGGHSNGNTTNAALSLTSSSDLTGASGAGSAVLAGGNSNPAGGNVTITAGDGATAGNVIINAGNGNNGSGGSINFSVANTTYATLSSSGLLVTGGGANGGSMSWSGNDQITGDPSFVISALGLSLTSSSDPIVLRSQSINLAGLADTTHQDGNIFMDGSGGIIITSELTALQLIGASSLVLGVGSPGTGVGFSISSSGSLGIGATSPSYGTAGQLLTSGGNNAAPTWSTPSVTVNTSAGLTGGGLLSLGGTLNLATDPTASPTFVGITITGTPTNSTDAATKGYVDNSSVTVATGNGLSGGGAVALGGTLTLTNTGVTSITGTSAQIVASASTGGVTLSIPPAAFIGNALQIGGGLPGPTSPNGATFQSGSGAAGFAIYSSVIATQSSSNYSVGFDGSNTSINGTTSVSLALNGSPVLAISSAGTSINGTLSATAFSGNGAALTNVVTSVTAGTNISVSGSSGAVTISASGVGIPVIVTGAYTANANDIIIADTTAGAFTVTLPASPVFGERVHFADGGGTWATNNLTVNGNGANISGNSSALVVTQNNDAFSLIYYNSTRGWIIAP